MKNITSSIIKLLFFTFSESKSEKNYKSYHSNKSSKYKKNIHDIISLVYKHKNEVLGSLYGKEILASVCWRCKTQILFTGYSKALVLNNILKKRVVKLKEKLTIDLKIIYNN